MKVKLLKFKKRKEMFIIEYREDNDSLDAEEGEQATLNPKLDSSGVQVVDSDISLITILNCYRIRRMSNEELIEFETEIGRSDLDIKYKEILEEEMLIKRGTKERSLSAMAVWSDLDNEIED